MLAPRSEGVAHGWVPAKVPPFGRVRLPSEGLVARVPRFVRQGVHMGLAGFRFLPVLFHRAAFEDVRPVFVDSHRVKGQVPFGGQLGEMSPFGVEVVVDLVSWREKGEGEERSKRKCLK